MRRVASVILVAMFVAFLGANVIVSRQSRAMTRWSEQGTRTAQPERLTTGARVRTLLFGVNVPRPTNLHTPADRGLTFDTFVYPNGLKDELEAWYIPGPRGEVVFLLFHGYASSKEHLLELALRLRRLGYGSLLVDFHGSGGSTGTDTTLGVREALDVAASVAEARRRWPDARLVAYGRSMGGAAVLRAIAHHEVMVDAVIVEATFDRLLSTIAQRFHAMGIPATPFAQLLAFWGGVHTGIDPFAHNPVDDAAAVRCPALILHGALDTRVTTEQARSVFDAIIGPKRLSIYPSAGHGDVDAADPGRWRHDIELIVAAVQSSGGHGRR